VPCGNDGRVAEEGERGEHVSSGDSVFTSVLTTGMEDRLSWLGVSTGLFRDAPACCGVAIDADLLCCWKLCCGLGDG